MVEKGDYAYCNSCADENTTRQLITLILLFQTIRLNDLFLFNSLPDIDVEGLLGGVNALQLLWPAARQMT